MRGLFCALESEREERERKGDLDKYERLDGDRNQTSGFLAVKKVVYCWFYRILSNILLLCHNHLSQLIRGGLMEVLIWFIQYNRTAEREAELIRPMPVLQKTIDYLLGLLDQPYDEKFLGMYNFLWDRMRAIRMDLRMQHIFNRDAITMLEQMVLFSSCFLHAICLVERQILQSFWNRNIKTFR